MTKEIKVNRIKYLDGLRGISVLAVLFGHASGSFAADFPVLNFLIKYLLPSASIGVHVFFVISGFIITHLLIKEVKETGKINTLEFYKRRIRRIFPAFYTYILCIIILCLTLELPMSIKHISTAATFTWNYGVFLPGTNSGARGDLLGHFWTLCLEEQFYLIWPGILFFFGLKFTRNFALTTIFLMPALRVISYFLFPNVRGQLMMMLHTGLDQIMIGCLLAFYVNDPICENQIKKLSKKFFALVATVYILYLAPQLGAHFKGAYLFTFGVAVQGLAITSILIYLRHNKNSILESPLLTHIGRISFSLYLWQQLFTFGPKYFSCVLFLFPWNIISSFFAAELSYKFIEKPFLKSSKPS